jgi:hypothetical protein
VQDYKRKCPSKGRGKARAAYDILAYINSYYAKTAVKTGSLAFFMDEDEFVEFHQKKRRMSEDDAKRLWKSIETDPDGSGFFLQSQVAFLEGHFKGLVKESCKRSPKRRY